MSPLLPSHLQALTYFPDRDEATGDLVQELARQEYARALPNPLVVFLKRVWGDFLQWVESLNALTPNLGWLVVLLALAIVITLIILFARPRLQRRARRAQTAGAAVDLDASLSAQDYRRRADRAYLAADYATAVLERFRALLARAEERTLLDPQPGRTASEVSTSLGLAFGEMASALHAAATLFNTVHYGHHEPTAEDVRWLAELEEQLSTATPGSAPTTPGLVVPR
ncbi:DUF4129 domain-containing protein [Arthrobacter rhombi]|uniref:DUF4129 domain-containing protein n=1 Tax=Arthrobacter rhombi TaxID=71253 RepID=UPI003FD5ACCC